MANYTFPFTTRISRLNRTLQSSAFLQASPFSGGLQSQDWGGRWWEYDFDFDVTQDQEGKSLSAFFSLLKGPANTFTFRDPSINNKYQPGTIRVKGASQTGDTLVTDGWIPITGQLLSYNTNFSNTSWINQSAFSPTTSNSPYPGRDGYLLTNPNDVVNRFIYQEPPIIDYSARKRMTVYCEDGGESTATDVVRFGIYNQSQSSWAVLVQYTFSTDTTVILDSNNDGTFSASVNSSDGVAPLNGGTRTKFINAYVNSTNQTDVFRCIVYPTGTTISNDTVHLYFVGYSEDGTASFSSTQREVFEVGDFISLGSGEDARLYQVVSSATSNSDDRESTLTITPNLRSSPADNAVVEVVDPIVALRPLQSIPNAITTPTNYRFTMQARENI